MLIAGKFLVLCILLMGSFGLILPGGSAWAGEGQGDFRLDAGDRVRVSVYNDSSLDSESMVDISGNVALPLVGHIPAAGLTLGELEKSIVAALLNNHAYRDPIVTVRVTEYRPIYVMGNVRIPGELPFQPGMTILNAISAAGGFGTAILDSDWGVMQQINLINTRRELEILKLNRVSLDWQMARLLAERDDAAEIQPPAAGMGDLFGDAEQRIFTQHRKQRQIETEEINSQITELANAISASDKQADNLSDTRRLFEEELAQIGALRDRGIVPDSQFLALRGQVADLTDKELELMVNKQRIQQQIGSLELSKIDREDQYRERILREIREVETELAENATELESVKQRIQEIERSKAEIAQEIITKIPGQYLVYRSSQSGGSYFKADDNTVLRPGDTIRVPRVIGEANEPTDLDTVLQANP